MFGRWGRLEKASKVTLVAAGQARGAARGAERHDPDDPARRAHELRRRAERCLHAPGGQPYASSHGYFGPDRPRPRKQLDSWKLLCYPYTERIRRVYGTDMECARSIYCIRTDFMAAHALQPKQRTEVQLCSLHFCWVSFDATVN